MQQKVIHPPTRVGELLRLSEEEEVFFLQRIRYISGEPMALQTAYVPLRFFPGIADIDFEKESLYATFRRFGMVPALAKQDMEAIVLKDADQAKLLGAEVGSPGLLSERLTYDLEGNPIEFTIALFRGEKYRFTVHLTNSEFVKA
ncbi:MAG: UTRA domain-containing protein [Candidatus Caldatribacterium sp.]|nr:UTRA domain-containing protein [Candidatus Caldatribacterium sp.]